MGKTLPRLLWIAVTAGALVALVASSVDLARYGDKVVLMRSRLETLTSNAKDGASTTQLAEEVVSQYKALGGGYKLVININGVIFSISLFGLFLQTRQSKRKVMDGQSTSDIFESKVGVNRDEKL